MNRNELVELLAEEMLFEVVASKIEEVDQIPRMLERIGYLDNEEEAISLINHCEIDLDSLEIIQFTVENGKIIIEFEIPLFGVSAFHNSQGILKVTASATGKCSIPDIDVFDWDEAFDWENGVWVDDFDEGIIEIIELQYTGESCDDWRAIGWMQQE